MRNTQLSRRPGIDFSLLREVMRPHLLAFALMTGLGTVFVLSSLALYFRVWRDNPGILSMAALLVFLICGLFLIGFACVSTFSSVCYYYQKGQQRRHGLNIMATVTAKTRDECVVERRDETRHIHIDELLLTVAFRFQFAGQSWEGEDTLNSEALFNALTKGQQIPVRILPWQPASASIRQRALGNQLRQTQPLVDDENALRTGEPLIETDSDKI